MAQTTILGRIGQLMRANVNALLDQAEDPDKMLDQLIRDFTNNIAEAQEAVAQTIGNLRMAEEDQREARDAGAEWADKARVASTRADQLRSGGTTTEADRLDDLAKIAIRRQMSLEEQVRTFQAQIDQQQQLVTQLKDGLTRLEAKREELVQKRDELVSRAKMAQARIQVQQAVKSVSVMDPTSDLHRFEERIRRQEALASGMEEVASSSLEDEFEKLQAGADEGEVDARLRAIKGGDGTARLAAGDTTTAS